MPLTRFKLSAIAEGGITTTELEDGTIIGVDIANDAVTTAKIADDAVTLPKLSATGTPDSTNFLRGDDTWAVVSVTSTAVSDSDNTSTGAFQVPVGTTAQRPSMTTSDDQGYIRFNTDSGALENWTGTEWLKISAAIPTLTGVSGSIYPGYASTLTLTGTNFLTANLVVNFLQVADGINEDVTVTPSSDTSATVAVPANVYNNVTGGNAVTIKVTNSDSAASGNQTVTATELPTGGTITSYDDGGTTYISHTFTSTGNFVVPTGESVSAQYLIVAGGGGGGNANGGGGGGGAGGMQTGSATLSAGTYTATVGGGGSGTSANTGDKGQSGGNSSFNSVTSIGGGGGGGDAPAPSKAPGLSGGSGGGGGRTGGTGGSGTSGQGNPGGSSSGNEGGGGGGKSNAGQNADGPNYAGAGGNGGTNTYRTGSSVTYAGGGGGGTENTGADNLGAGGSGGGGNGGGQPNSSSGPVVAANSGSTNTGGGGGGSADFTHNVAKYAAGNGGSGIVVVRYPLGS